MYDYIYDSEPLIAFKMLCVCHHYFLKVFNTQTETLDVLSSNILLPTRQPLVSDNLLSMSMDFPIIDISIDSGII